MTDIRFPLNSNNVAQCMAERDAEIERLRAALEWYASRERTREQYIWDDGSRARDALAKEEGKSWHPQQIRL